MKTRLSLFTLLLATLCFGQNAPPPPEGYSWKPILNGKSGLLVPDGWFFKFEKSGDTSAYFVSKENIETEGEFLTGLSLNVIPDLAAKTGVKSSEYALVHMTEIAKRNEVLEAVEKVTGGFKLFIFRFKSSKSDPGDTMVYNLYVCNDRTGALWLYIFESPEAEWDEAWEVGDVLLSNLLLNPEI